MSEQIVLNTIEEALEDFRAGKIIIVVDDPDRENEGDFVCAAELITPETVNFMLHHGRGVLCAPITEAKNRDRASTCRLMPKAQPSTGCQLPSQ